jgi:hypothetical protein
MAAVKFKVNAGNDTNGNPRRGWVILSSETGELRDFVDEGYEGTGALDRKGYGAAPGDLEIEVKPSVYREFRRLEKGS